MAHMALAGVVLIAQPECEAGKVAVDCKQLAKAECIAGMGEEDVVVPFPFAYLIVAFAKAWAPPITGRSAW